MRWLVHHQRGRGLRLGLGQLDQLAHRLGVGGRVGDHDVVESLPGQVERLRQGEGEDAAESRVQVEDPPQDRDRPDRLRRDPDRQPARLGEHRGCVRAQRVQVDEREGRLDRLEDRLVAIAQGVEVGAHGRASLSTRGP